MDTIFFQGRVMRWVKKCFGEKIALDPQERNMRFFEEATELVQARRMDREQAHKIVDFVYDRPAGFQKQEIAGSMITLCALAEQAKVDIAEVCYTEIERIEKGPVLAEIKEKRKRKPKEVKADEAPSLGPEFFENAVVTKPGEPLPGMEQKP